MFKLTNVPVFVACSHIFVFSLSINSKMVNFWVVPLPHSLSDMFCFDVFN